MNHNTITPISPEEQADFDAWSEELPKISNEVLPTEDAAIEAARNRLINTPSETTEQQVDRVANLVSEASEETTDSTTEAETSYSSRSARLANTTANRLSSVAEKLEAEGPKGLARAALRRIGRAATAPLRAASAATKNKVGAFFEAGNRKFDTILTKGEALFTPASPTETVAEAEPSAEEAEAQIDNPDAEDDSEEYYTKKSAKAIDWVGEKIEGKEGSFRELAATKLYNYAVKVDERDGTYASRGAEKVRNNLDKFDKWSNENEGWLKKRIQEKARDAKERRGNRVKKQRLRTIGRKAMAYHRAGKEAAKNI